MMRFERLLRNTAFGAFIGTSATLTFVWLLDASLNDVFERFYTFLFTATISLLAVSLTLVGVFSSIENQNRLSAYERARKLEAARAFLPSALSQLCEICKWGILYSHDFATFKDKHGRHEFERVSVNQLTLSDEIISVFREIIELSESDRVSLRLSGLLREHQIFLARWKSEFAYGSDSLIRTDENIRQRTVAWAYLHSIASSLFSYARNDDDDVYTVVEEQDIRSSINSANVRDLWPENVSEEIGLYARTFERRFT